MSAQLLEATFVDGLRMPHYANGRLLSAEDLQADQAATLTRLSRLGQATGHGVVEGLMAAQVGNTGVQVTAGLGVNRAGQLVRLPGAVTLSLVPASGPAPAVLDAGLFADCAVAPTNGGGSSLADGAYLLTVTPVARLEGQAPLKATPSGSLPAGCAARWEVEGAQFKAIKLAAFGVGGSGATDKNRQNRLAHWCFGSDHLRRLPPDPFRFGDDYGGLATVAAADLTECDLPLAVFYWQGAKVAFLDPWAVRRRLVQLLPSADWRGVLSDRRVADAEARFLQFQDQVSRLLAAGNVAALKAADHFRYLPPVGYLPIRPPQFLVEHLVSHLLEQLKKTRFTGVGGPPLARAGQSVVRAAKRTNPWALAAGSEAYAALFNNQPLLDTLLEAPGTALQPTADALVAQPKVSVEDLLRAQTLARLPKAGFDLQTFFGAAMPDAVHLIDGESVDFYLQRAWFDEAIDLAASPRFDVYLVQDVWLRLVGAALLQAMDVVLAGRTAGARQAAKAQLAALLPPAVPGVADVPYAVFVKQVRPKVAVPVRKPTAPPPGITGNVAIWHGFDAAGAEAKVLQSFAAQVQRDNPGLQLTLQAVPGESLDQQLRRAVAADNAPDLVLWRDQFLAEWIQGGVVQPLTGLASLHPSTLPAAQQAVTRGRALYGLPLALETVALHLNGKLFQELALAPPKTVDELVAVVQQLARRQFPALLPASLLFLYGLFVAEGGPLRDERGRCNFEAFTAGFELVQRLVRNGATFVDYEQAAQSFRGQKSALTLDGPWALAQNQQDLGGSLLITPLPPGAVGPARPLAFAYAFYLVTGSQNQAVAAQTAELLASAEVQKALARDAQRVPARADAAVNDPHMAVFVQAATTAHALPAFPGLFAWLDPLDRVIAQVVDGLAPDAAAKMACEIISG
ncbi:MAG: extracellular solute-binding protein [Caldilineales bacterium]|nr:extracellular solute-binding protein [Caldilineales bacterium]